MNMLKKISFWLAFVFGLAVCAVVFSTLFSSEGSGYVLMALYLFWPLIIGIPLLVILLKRFRNRK
jgi:uncharacterized membrane protein YhaH (DUF805 family)